MPAKYFSIIRNYVLSVSSQRKYNFYHQNTLLDAFRTNSRNIIGRNPSIVIPLLANQDLTPMLRKTPFCNTAILRYRFSNMYLGLFLDLTIVGRLGQVLLSCKSTYIFILGPGQTTRFFTRFFPQYLISKSRGC